MLAALHRPVEEGEEAHPGPGSDPVVLASGNLGLISFPDIPGRASRARVERAHPALLTTLANHPGVGFLLVDGVVLGRDGKVARLDVPGRRRSCWLPSARARRRPSAGPTPSRTWRTSW